MTMPQSSLMEWLSKPAPKGPAETTTQDETKQLPTPPATSGAETNGAIQNGPASVPRLGLKVGGLPPNVELRECRKEDIKSFKRLNSLLLPIPYGDSFYRETMEDAVTSNITLVALWHDNLTTAANEKGTLVGAIRCRLLTNLPGGAPVPQRKEGPMLYLSTLVLLSPHRGHGIAAKLLDVMVRRAVNDYGVSSVGAHVWEANEEGLAWYCKRGFREMRREEGYYRRLDPQGAVVVVKDVGVMDLLQE